MEVEPEDVPNNHSARNIPPQGGESQLNCNFSTSPNAEEIRSWEARDYLITQAIRTATEDEFGQKLPSILERRSGIISLDSGVFSESVELRDSEQRKYVVPDLRDFFIPQGGNLASKLSPELFSNPVAFIHLMQCDEINPIHTISISLRAPALVEAIEHLKQSFEVQHDESPMYSVLRSFLERAVNLHLERSLERQGVGYLKDVFEGEGIPKIVGLEVQAGPKSGEHIVATDILMPAPDFNPVSAHSLERVSFLLGAQRSIVTLKEMKTEFIGNASTY